MPVIQYNNSLIPYHVMRSNRAKLLRLEWQGTHARCIAPQSTSNKDILQFVFEHAAWLYKQHARQQNLANQGAYQWPTKMCAGAKVPFLGVQLILRESDQQTIWRKAKCLYYPVGTSAKQLEALVVNWLKHQAAKYALHWSKKITRNFGLKPKSIKLKTQKSRWGSCGIHNDIHLNWRLVCCPRRTFMYVVVHEHSHLVHKNHGKRFWALVEKMMLDYKHHDKWLNKNGSYIGK